MRNRANWNFVVLAALAAVLVARIALAYGVFSDVYDESTHISAGVRLLETGEYLASEPYHPPLSRVAVAVLPYFIAGLRLGDARHLWADGLWAKGSIDEYWDTLAWARAGNLVWALLSVGVVYLWSRRLAGEVAALVAVAFLICSPTFLAHNALATLDAAGAALIGAATFSLARWAQNPGWRYCLLTCLWSGAAVVSKFSAVVFLPLIAIAFFAYSRGSLWWKDEALEFSVVRGALARLGTTAVLIGIIVWAGYRFEVGPVPPLVHKGVPAMGWVATLEESFVGRSMPAPEFVHGLLETAHFNQRGARAYLLGEISQHGWWYYFPVAVVLKSSPFLLLTALFGAVLCVRRRAPRDAVFALLALVAMIGTAMTSHVNLGVRHVLPVYLYLAVLAAQPFASALAKSKSKMQIALFALLALHAGDSVFVHPDYLAYFTPLARGQEERLLADSNLDWGQDLARLGTFAKDGDMAPLNTNFGRPLLEKMGISTQRLSPDTVQPGWCVLTTNERLGVTLRGEEFAWLRSRVPDVRIGKSIWLYYVSPEETRPR